MRALSLVLFFISLNAWALPKCDLRVVDAKSLSYDELKSAAYEVATELDSLQLQFYSYARIPLLKPLQAAFAGQKPGSLNLFAQADVAMRIRRPQLEAQIQDALKQGEELKAQVRELEWALAAVKGAMGKHLSWFSSKEIKIARGPFRKQLKDWSELVASASFLINVQTRALQVLAILAGPTPRQVTPLAARPTALTGLALWEWYYFHFYIIDDDPDQLFQQARRHTWNFQNDYLVNGFADYYQQISHFLHPGPSAAEEVDEDSGARGGSFTSGDAGDTVVGYSHDHDGGSDGGSF